MRRERFERSLEAWEAPVMDQTTPPPRGGNPNTNKPRGEAGCMARFSYLVDEGVITEEEAASLNKLARSVDLEVSPGMNSQLRVSVIGDVGITVQAVENPKGAYDIYNYEYEADSKEHITTVRTFEEAVDELRQRG